MRSTTATRDTHEDLGLGKQEQGREREQKQRSRSPGTTAATRTGYEGKALRSWPQLPPEVVRCVFLVCFFAFVFFSLFVIAARFCRPPAALSLFRTHRGVGDGAGWGYSPDPTMRSDAQKLVLDFPCCLALGPTPVHRVNARCCSLCSEPNSNSSSGLAFSRWAEFDGPVGHALDLPSTPNYTLTGLFFDGGCSCRVFPPSLTIFLCYPVRVTQLWPGLSSFFFFFSSFDAPKVHLQP
ncbi:hypothetical protein C8R47DRAFT_1157277 [Mycena vitilis]|nr:hypothetical protein C8R47DRAFT_1157277 [Mycena vitilis]